MAKGRAKRSYLFEILVSGLLLVVMTCVRFSYTFDYITELHGDTGLLEMAMIRQGAGLPYFVSTLGGIYTGILRMVFWLAGNREQAVFYVQALMQIVTLFFFFLAYRKACGLIFAGVSVLAVMFAGSGLWLIGEVTPGNLLLLLAAVYFLFFSFALVRADNKKDSRFFFVLGFFWTGVLCGLLSALDSLGLLLAALSVLLIACKKKLPTGFLLGTAGGIAAAFFGKSCYYGLDFWYPYGEYYDQYFTGEIWDPILRFGISSVAAGVLALLFTVGTTGRLLLEKIRPKEEIAELPGSVPAPKEQTQETKDRHENMKETGDTKALQEKTAVRYIENPLPVPKRHVKKEMTYAFEPSQAQMHFDIDNLPEGADYDLDA